MPLIIKGKLIDKSTPVICVPIVERSYDDIMAKATRLVLKKVGMVEWRADYFEGLFDREMLHKTLQGLKGIFKDTLFLVTVRSVKEGGMVSLPEEEYEELLIDIAKSRCADLIDVEYFQFVNPAGLVSSLQETGTAVIVSRHDFKETPSKAVNIRLLEEMQKSDPDIIKLCTMPKSLQDVLELGSALGAFDAGNPGCLLIGIAMGEEGKISRIMPKDFSSCVTFASLDAASAPGQIDYDELKGLMDSLEDET